MKAMMITAAICDRRERPPQSRVVVPAPIATHHRIDERALEGRVILRWRLRA
jgi:hypothetical protein